MISSSHSSTRYILFRVFRTYQSLSPWYFVQNFGMTFQHRLSIPRLSSDQRASSGHKMFLLLFVQETLEFIDRMFFYVTFCPVNCQQSDDPNCFAARSCFRMEDPIVPFFPNYLAGDGNQNVRCLARFCQSGYSSSYTIDQLNYQVIS